MLNDHQRRDLADQAAEMPADAEAMTPEEWHELQGELAAESAADAGALEPRPLADYLVLRWALRDLLRRRGVWSNPAVSDAWIVDQLARLLQTESTYADAARAVEQRSTGAGR